MTDGGAPGRSLPARLQADLPAAIKARDGVRVAALRSALAAIANAEAVALPPEVPHPRGGPVASSRTGLGAGEAPRRVLTELEARAAVEGEVAERHLVATRMAGAGHAAEAERLRAEAAVLLLYLEGHERH